MDRDLIEAECSRHVPPVNPPHQHRLLEDNSVRPRADGAFSSRMSVKHVNSAESALLRLYTLNSLIGCKQQDF